ncbi:BtpA/SgcQ family protein [Halovenus halobia]|uniref:BtpA/SgcQ family protein n=1 Tax=Halovenus halobia TaxID=3396622 RepID=UPI003F55DC14
MFDGDGALIGMVHLPPLPGAPEYEGSREAIRTAARKDARTLADSGFDAVLVENFGDAPFYPDSVPRHTVAEMTAVVEDVTRAVDLPVGVNVLRNDAAAAVSTAGATGADFVRVNVHTGVRATDQGWLEGQAHETMRLRDRLETDVSVFVDIDVKHSASPVDRDLGALVRETIDRGLADGLIVSGPETGSATDSGLLSRVLAARDDCAPDVPVLVGSGVRPDNAAALLGPADGAIVGTALKKNGETTNRVDAERAAQLVEAVQS